VTEADHPQDESALAPKASSPPRKAVEWLVIIAVAVLVAVLLRAFVLQTFFIPSASMEPTLQIGDRIIVSKLSYKLHGIHRGDMIVFARPPAENCGGEPVADLVKRVIGLPGETIASQGNDVLINGKPITQDWQSKGSPLGPPIRSQRIPNNAVFVMGDNRTNSCDSRMWGPVNQSLVVGHVVLRIWPISQFHVF
jgi:signal peptidase I